MRDFYGYNCSQLVAVLIERCLSAFMKIRRYENNIKEILLIFNSDCALNADLKLHIKIK